MRYVAWTLFGVAALVLLGSIPLAIAIRDTYGAPAGLGEWWSQSWWVPAVAAVPALAGYLVLRIARDGEASRR